MRHRALAFGIERHFAPAPVSPSTPIGQLNSQSAPQTLLHPFNTRAIAPVVRPQLCQRRETCRSLILQISQINRRSNAVHFQAMRHIVLGDQSTQIYKRARIQDRSERQHVGLP